MVGIVIDVAARSEKVVVIVATAAVAEGTVNETVLIAVVVIIGVAADEAATIVASETTTLATGEVVEDKARETVALFAVSPEGGGKIKDSSVFGEVSFGRLFKVENAGTSFEVNVVVADTACADGVVATTVCRAETTSVGVGITPVCLSVVTSDVVLLAEVKDLKIDVVGITNKPVAGGMAEVEVVVWGDCCWGKLVLVDSTAVEVPPKEKPSFGAWKRFSLNICKLFKHGDVDIVFDLLVAAAFGMDATASLVAVEVVVVVLVLVLAVEGTNEKILCVFLVSVVATAVPVPVFSWQNENIECFVVGVSGFEGSLTKLVLNFEPENENAAVLLPNKPLLVDSSDDLGVARRLERVEGCSGALNICDCGLLVVLLAINGDLVICVVEN